MIVTIKSLRHNFVLCVSFPAVLLCTYLILVTFSASKHNLLPVSLDFGTEKTIQVYLAAARGHISSDDSDNDLERNIIRRTAAVQPELINLPSNANIQYTVERRVQSKSNELSQVLNNIDTCMKTADIGSDISLLNTSRRNAELFLNEYRKVIPKKSLSGYASHCWNIEYNISVSKTLHKNVFGNIGDIKFEYSGFQIRENAVKDLNDLFVGTFTSSTVCLPNIYLLGVEKCGTTFLWCFITKLMNGVRDLHFYQIVKEPYFWTPLDYANFQPNASQIGSSYIPNFIRALVPGHGIDVHKNISLIDACPSTIMEWPIFQSKEPAMSNYCLYPSVFPAMFPRAKFIISLRNPVTLMYSAFWWSFKTATACIPPDKEAVKAVVVNHTKGPELFHKRVLEKINMFLKCMTDKSSAEARVPCEILNTTVTDYSFCIRQRSHLLSTCVHGITNRRQLTEVVIHRGMYYVHVRKWLSIIPRERLLIIKFEDLTVDLIQSTKDIHHFLKPDVDLEVLKRMKKDFLQGCHTNENDVDYKHDPALQMKISTKQVLEKFFRPFNIMLSESLNDSRFLWE